MCTSKRQYNSPKPESVQAQYPTLVGILNVFDIWDCVFFLLLLCLVKGTISLPDSGDESEVVGGLLGTAVGAMAMAAALEAKNEERRKLDLREKRRMR